MIMVLENKPELLIAAVLDSMVYAQLAFPACRSHYSLLTVAPEHTNSGILVS